MDTICVAAILKNEHLFIDEWLIYHKMIGVDHFFIYDNNSTPPLANHLAPHQDYVTITLWDEAAYLAMPGRNRQTKAYMHAAKREDNVYTWTSFIDGDEFIVLKKHANLKQFLKDYDSAGSVTLNWHMFGHNGYFNKPPKMVTSALLRRKQQPSRLGKTICRTAIITDIVSPHHCQTKQGWIRVDANNMFYNELPYTGKTAIAHINHYQCRYFKGYLERVERGNVAFDNEEDITPAFKWQYDTDETMKTFVRTLAVHYSEITDEHMLKYEPALVLELENIKRLRGQRGTLLSRAIFNKQACILSQLHHIAGILQKLLGTLVNDGLLHGNMGVAVFLMHYACYKKDKDLIDQVNRAIEDILDRITATSAGNYGNGVAGIGSAIQYLKIIGLVNTDTEPVMMDLDTLVNYHMVAQPHPLSIADGLIGYGWYFAWRAKFTKSAAHNQLLYELVELLDTPYDTITDIKQLVFFLTDIVALGINEVKTKHYLEYALDKLETMIYEDKFFIIQNSFNPLDIANVFFETAHKTGCKRYAETGKVIIAYCRDTLESYFKPQNITSSSTWFRYCVLYQKYHQHTEFGWFEEYTGDWLMHGLQMVEKEITSVKEGSSAEISLANGLAAAGLGMLALADPDSSHWLGLHTPDW